MPSSAFTTVRALAADLAVKPDKVLEWIRAGELRALNVAQNRGGRPRWRIGADALAAFLAARSSSPAPRRPTRPRPKRQDVVEFF